MEKEDAGREGDGEAEELPNEDEVGADETFRFRSRICRRVEIWQVSVPSRLVLRLEDLERSELGERDDVIDEDVDGLQYYLFVIK